MKAAVVNTLLFLLIFTVIFALFTWLAAQVFVETRAPDTPILPLLPRFLGISLPGSLIFALFLIFARMNRLGIRSIWAHLPLFLLLFGGFFGLMELLPTADGAEIPTGIPAPENTVYAVGGDVYRYRSVNPPLLAGINPSESEDVLYLTVNPAAAAPEILDPAPWTAGFFTLPPEFDLAISGAAKLSAIFIDLRNRDSILYAVTTALFWLFVYSGVAFLNLTGWPLLNLMIGFGAMQVFPILFAFLYGENAQELGNTVFKSPFEGYFPAAVLGIGFLLLSLAGLAASRRDRG